MLAVSGNIGWHNLLIAICLQEWRKHPSPVIWNYKSLGNSDWVQHKSILIHNFNNGYGSNCENYVWKPVSVLSILSLFQFILKRNNTIPPANLLLFRLIPYYTFIIDSKRAETEKKEKRKIKQTHTYRDFSSKHWFIFLSLPIKCFAQNSQELAAYR